MDHKSFVQAWYGLDTYGRYTKFPTKVYRVINSTMGGFPVTVEDAQTQYDAFIEKLSAFLNATVTDLEPSVEWKKSGPVSDQELLVYTNMVSSLPGVTTYESLFREAEIFSRRTSPSLGTSRSSCCRSPSSPTGRPTSATRRSSPRSAPRRAPRSTTETTTSPTPATRRPWRSRPTSPSGGARR